MEENLFTSYGRIRRRVYWLRWLLVFFINVVVNLAIGMNENLFNVSVMISLALAVFIIIQGVKRIHDTNRSGWYILVPIYNFVLLLTDGTPGENDYGSDPKQRPDAIANADGNIALEGGLYPNTSGYDTSLLTKALLNIVIVEVCVTIFWVLLNQYARISGNFEIYSKLEVVIFLVELFSASVIPILCAYYTPNKNHKTIFMVIAIVLALYHVLRFTMKLAS